MSQALCRGMLWTPVNMDLASMQQAQVETQLTDKEKASIQMAVKKAQKLAASNAIAKSRPGREEIVMVAGVMMTAQRRTITHDKSHEWKGHFLRNPPNEIVADRISNGFVHVGFPVGVASKAAIVYVAMDSSYPDLGYLLAWDKKPNGISKVYVEAGYFAKFVIMNWNEIEAKLDASTNESLWVDSMTGATAGAAIMDLGNLAVIGAVFDQLGLRFPPI